VSTLSIEAMMQDRKALQAGTSHFLGQNFSRAQQIKFQDQNGQEVYAWTTSWGVSTRLVGALVMTHGDDDGLILPPKLAPKHIVVLPIYRNDQDRSQVLPYCQQLVAELNAQSFSGGPLRAWIDDRDLRGGEKNWQHVKRGVPLRVEVGPRDIAKNAVFVARRDTGEKRPLDRGQFVQTAGALLEEMQGNLYQRALQLREANTVRIDSLDDFRAYFTPQNAERPEIHGGFALCHWCEDPAVDQILGELKVTVRCLPLDAAQEPGTCIFTGRPSQARAVLAKAY
jgi:prolyl-tRNA synthetase